MTYQLKLRAGGYAMTSASGVIRVREREMPLRTTRSIVAEIVDDERLVHPVIEAERVTTFEGELGSLVRVRGEREGRAFERTLGLVFGEDFYVRVDGVATAGSIHDAVREHTLSIRLDLGERRRRRYPYVPPAGWTPHPRGLIDQWLAPGFPNDPGAILVLPAMPIQPHALDGVPFTTKHFRRATISRSSTRDTVVLQDDRYTYRCQLEDPASAHREIFAELVDSIEPLPVPTVMRGTLIERELIASWSD
jgi:hypothetical protein